MTEEKITQLIKLHPDELHFVGAGANGFPELLAKGLEASVIEKAMACGCEACLCITDMTKAELSGKAINDLPDSDFAHIEPGGKKDAEGKTTPRSLRHFPIHDKAHAENALARAPQSPFGDKALPKIKAAAKKFGVQVEDEPPVKKGLQVIVKDNGSVASAVLTGNQNGPYPGSPAWEAQDAQTLIDAGQLIAQAGAKLQDALEREQTEVAVGQAADQEDVFDLQDALCALDAVLGITARLAFTEEVEGGVGMSKEGRRLSGVSVAKVVAARDKASELSGHLSDLLGSYDPTKAVGTGTAAKGVSVKMADEVMTKEQLETHVSELVAKGVADGLAAVKTAEAEAAAKAKADRVAKKAEAKKALDEKRTRKLEKAKAKADAFRAKQDAMSDDDKEEAAEKARLKSERKSIAKAIRLQARLVEKGIDPATITGGPLAKEIEGLRSELVKMQNEPAHGGLLLTDQGLSPEMRKAFGLDRLQRGGSTEETTSPDAIAKSFDAAIEKAKASGKIGEVEKLEADRRFAVAKSLEVSRGYGTNSPA